MKRLTPILILVLFCLSIQSLWAQQVFPVKINGTWLPPYSSLLSDYAADKSQDLMFTVLLNDPVEVSRDVRFRLTIENDGREIMITNPNFLPQPMTLHQFTPELITGAEIAEYLQVQNLVGTRGRNSSNFLPEGFNRICLEVIDYQRGVPISAKACVSGFFRPIEAPILEIPTCHKIIPPSPTQNMLFRWLPRHIGQPNAPAVVEYEFTLVELLPGIGDPNDGFEQAIQIYQTTTMVPSLLYLEGEPLLEKNKTYAWRVQAKDMMGGNVFVNNGFSKVCTFSMEERKVRRDLVAACEAAQTDAGSIKQSSNDGQLVVGDEIKLGFFDLTIKEITASGDGYSGVGMVKIPFLKAQVAIDFKDLKINDNGQVYEVREARAKFDNAFNLTEGDLQLARYGLDYNSEFFQAMNTFLARKEAKSQFVSNRHESDQLPTNLPIIIDKQGKSGEALPQVMFLDMNFTAHTAYLTALSMVNSPAQSQQLAFSGKTIAFTPFGIKQGANLQLTADQELRRDNGDIIRFFAKDDGTKLAFNCEGFDNFQIKGEYTFSQSNLLPTEEGINAVKVAFRTESKNLFDFTAETEAITFQLPTKEGTIFKTTTGVLDFTLVDNKGINFPSNYTEEKASNWKGFYFNKASAELKDNWKLSEGIQIKNLKEGSLIIGTSGVWGNLQEKDILTFEKGRIQDWPFSVDAFSLEIAQSKVDKALLNGKIKVPIIDEPFPYEGQIDLASKENISIDIKPKSAKGGMSLWKGNLEYGTDAIVKAVKRKIGNQTDLFPYASLEGQFNMNVSSADFTKYLKSESKDAQIAAIKKALDLTKELELKIEQLPLKGLIVDPLAASKNRYKLEGVDFDKAKIQIGGLIFPITAVQVNYQPKTGEKPEELGLELVVVKGKHQVSFTLWARKDSPQSFVLNRIETKMELYDCDCVYLEQPSKERWTEADLNQLKKDNDKYAITASLDNESLIEETISDNQAANTFSFVGGLLTIPLNEKFNLKLKSQKVGAGLQSNGGIYNQETKGAIKIPKIPTGYIAKAKKIANANTEYELPLDLTENPKILLNKFQKTSGVYAYDFPKGSKLILAGIQVNSNLTEAAATILLEVDGTIFGNANVKFKPGSVEFDKLLLYLLEDQIKNDPRLPFTLKKELNPDKKKGSFAEIACEGFKGFNVQCEYLFDYKFEVDKTKCKQVTGKTSLMEIKPAIEIAKVRKAWLTNQQTCKPELYQQLKLPFTIGGKNLKSFKASVVIGKLHPLILKDFESVLFHLKEAHVYYNYGKRPEWKEKAPVPKFNQTTFAGIHFKEIGLQPIGFFKGVGTSRKILQIPATDFVFKPGEGLYGNVDKSDVIKKGEGDLGGWKYTLEEFKLNIAANKITTIFDKKVINEENIRSGGGMVFKGKILMPVVAPDYKEKDKNGKEKTVDGYMKYLGALGFDATAQTPAPFFRIEEAQQGKMFKIPFWKLKMQLGTNVETPTSIITLALNESAGDYWFGSEFEPAAVLNGVFIIDYNPSKPKSNGYFEENGFTPKLTIPRVSFTNWKINDPGIMNDCSAAQKGGIRNMHFDAFGLGGTASTGSVNQGVASNLSDQVLAGLPINIWDINFNCIKTSKKGEKDQFGYKIDFEIHVDLIELTKPAVGKVKKFVQAKAKRKKIPTKNQPKPKLGGSTNASTKKVGVGSKLGGAASKSANKGKGKGKGGSNFAVSGLKVTSQLAITCQYGGNDGNLKFKWAKPEAFLVDADFSIFSIKGGLVLMGGDPTYGDGFKGYLDVGIPKWKGFRAKTVFQTGKTDYDDSKGAKVDGKDYRYFFFDFEFLLAQGFGIPNPPAPNPIFYFHGAGGGYQHKMIMEDPSPEETFSKRKKSKGVKTVGAVSHDSGILSEQADPYGYLKPGKSLTGFNFKPRPDIYGFGGKAIFSLQNSANLAWWDMGFNINFTDKFVPKKINVYGNAYLLTPPDDNGNPAQVGDPDGAAGIGSVRVELNIEKKFLMATATFDLNYPPANDMEGKTKLLKDADMQRIAKKSYAGGSSGSKFQIFNAHAFGEASAVMLFGDAVQGVDLPVHKAGEWQIKIGTPKKGVGMEFQFTGITFAQMMMYMQAGYALDPMPHITEMIPTWPSSKSGKPRTTSSITQAYSGNGLIFGAHFKIPDNTYEFLIFRARLAAGAGFDISMIHYDKKFVQTLGCAGNNGKFGMNNWYARGQAYGYLKGSLDMHINLGFIDKWVNLVDLNAIALMQAELPNPTWMRALVKAQGSVLNGLIDVNINFKVEVGKRCDALKGNPIASIPVLESIAPSNNAPQVPIYQNPAVSFNFPVGKLVVLEDYDDPSKPKKRSFRPHLKSMKIYKMKGSQTLIKNGFLLSKDLKSATLPLDKLLEPKTKYKVEVIASWQEYTNGRWADFIYKGKAYTETKTSEFITGDRPDKINSKMLAYQAPDFDQRYWHKDYAFPKLLFKQSGYEYLFPQSSDQLKKTLPPAKRAGIPTSNVPLKYIIKLTEFDPKNGKELRRLEVPVGAYPGKSADIQRPVVAYKAPKQYANLNYKLPYVKVEKVSGKLIEFRKLNDLDLKKGHLYQLELVRQPVKAFMQEVETQSQTSQAYNKTQRLKTNNASGQLDGDVVGGTITTRITRLKSSTPQPGVAEMNKVLYKYHFGVSQYDHLYEKLADMKADPLPEKYALAKEKYDHPKSRVQAFPTLPLGRTYKDRYFVFTGSKEGIDKTDRIKLLKNLIVNNPKLPIAPMRNATVRWTTSKATKTLSADFPGTLTKGAHPWEKELYLNRSETVAAYININKGKRKNSAFDITNLDQKNILDKTRIDEINKKDSWKTIDKEGNHTNSGISSYEHHKHPPITKVVQFNKFRYQIANHSWFCNKNYGNSTWEAQNALSASGWLEFMKEILTPYYHVDDWAFHLRFNPDGNQLSLSTQEKAAKKISNIVPKKNIEGTTSQSFSGTTKKPIHFAFEDSRERILKTQFLLAKSVATNLVFVSYLSERDWKCAMGDLFHDVNYWFHRNSIGDGISASAFKDKYVDLAYPKVNVWKAFDEVISKDIRTKTGEKIWKLPIGEGKIDAKEVKSNRSKYREVILKRTSTQSDEITLVYPQHLGSKLEQLAVYDYKTKKLLRFYDKRINEDHFYEHNGDHIKMTVDYNPKQKDAGFQVVKGKGEYMVLLNFSDKGAVSSHFNTNSSNLERYPSRGYDSKDFPFRDHQWLRLEWNASNNELFIKRPVDIPALKSDPNYKYNSTRKTLEVIDMSVYNDKNLRLGSILSTWNGYSTRLWQKTDLDYDPQTFLFAGAKTTDIKGLPTSIKSRGIVPNRTNTFYLKVREGTFAGYGVGYKYQNGYIDYQIARDFFTRGKATILLQGLKQKGDDCKFKPLPSSFSYKAKPNMTLKLPNGKSVDLPSRPSIGTRQFSLDMKIKPDALQPINNSNLNDKGLKIYFNSSLFLSLNSNAVNMKHIRFQGSRWNITTLVGGTTKLESGKWHRITISYDGQFMTLYNNGELIASQAVKPEQIGGNKILFNEIKADKIAIDYLTLLKRPISGCNYFWSEYQFVRDRENSLREFRKKDKEVVFSFEFDSYRKGNDGIGSNRIQDHSGNGHHGLLKINDFICDASIWVKGEEATNAYRHNKKAPPPYTLSYSGGKNYLNITPCDAHQLLIYEKRGSQPRPKRAIYTSPLPVYLQHNEPLFSWAKTHSKNRNESRVLSSGVGMFQFPFDDQSYDILLTFKKSNYGAKPETYYFIIPPGAKADRKMIVRKHVQGNYDYMPLSLNNNPEPILKVDYKSGQKALTLSHLNKKEPIEAMSIYKIYQENGKQKEHRLAFMKDFTLDGFKWIQYQNGKPSSMKYKDHKWSQGLILPELQTSQKYILYIKTKDKTTSIHLDAEFWRRNTAYAYFIGRFRAGDERFFPPDLNPYKIYIEKNSIINLVLDPKNKLKKAVCYDAKGNSILYWEPSYKDNLNNSFLKIIPNKSGEIEASPVGYNWGTFHRNNKTHWWVMPYFMKGLSNTLYLELEDGSYQIDLNEKSYFKQLKPAKGAKFQLTYPVLAIEVDRSKGMTFRKYGDFSSVDLQSMEFNHRNGQNVFKIAKMLNDSRYRWTHSTICANSGSPKVAKDWTSMTAMDWSTYDGIKGSTVWKSVNLRLAIKTSKGYHQSYFESLLKNYEKNWYRLIVFSGLKNSLPKQTNQQSSSQFPYPQSTRNMAIKMEPDGRNVKNDFVAVPYSRVLNFSNQFTIETWIKRKKGLGKGGSIIRYQVRYSKGYRLSISSDGVLGFGLGTNKGELSVGPKPNVIKQSGLQDRYVPFPKDQLNDNKWHHVAITFSGTALKLIVDGTIVASKTTATAQMLPPNCGMKLILGDNINYGHIQMDEFRLWNVERTLSQINSAKSQSLQGNEKGLVLYYNFNHEGGTKMVKDLSPSQLHGNLEKFYASIDKCWIPFDGPAVKTYVPPKPIIAEVKPLLLEVGPGSQYKYKFTRFQVDISGGKPPYTIIYKEGNNNKTRPSYTPGYNIKGSEINQNTIYTLVEVQDAKGLKSLPANIKGKFEVKYIPKPSSAQTAQSLKNLSGNKQANSSTGSTKSSGKNYALNFQPGSQLAVNPARELRLANNFTIDFWAKIDPNGREKNQIILSKESGFELMLMDIGGNRRLLRFGNITAMLPPSINTGWHHIAVSVDQSGQGALFLDGNQIGRGRTSLYPRDAVFKLGNNRSGFVGTMDNLRIWKTAVDQRLISELYRGSLSGQQSNLVLYYDFNQGGPGTRSVKNASPSGNSKLDGQLQMDPQRSWVEGKQ